MTGRCNRRRGQPCILVARNLREEAIRLLSLRRWTRGNLTERERFHLVVGVFFWKALGL